MCDRLCERERGKHGGGVTGQSGLPLAGQKASASQQDGMHLPISIEERIAATQIDAQNTDR